MNEFEINLNSEDLKKLELEEELQKLEIIINIDKLAKSNIKQIVLPLHRFIEWRCLDEYNNFLRKSEIFDSCLAPADVNKAKQLNEILQTRIWNLLDENVKKDMNFRDFVD